MQINRVTDAMSVAPQIQPGLITALAKAGYKCVICNRPDDEDPGQPSAESIRTAAEAAGIAFHHIPMVGANVTPGMLDAFAAALDAAAEGPTLAYCRSGTRSCMLWSMVTARSGALPVDQVLAAAQRAGYDFSPQAPFLQKLAEDA